jgi:hypothetical protein
VDPVAGRVGGGGGYHNDWLVSDPSQRTVPPFSLLLLSLTRPSLCEAGYQILPPPPPTERCAKTRSRAREAATTALTFPAAFTKRSKPLQ